MIIKANISISEISVLSLKILAISILSFFFLQLFTVKSSAILVYCKTYSASDCYGEPTYYYSAGCYNRTPAWGSCAGNTTCTTNVNGKSSSIAYCSNKTSITVLVSDDVYVQNNLCSNYRNWTTLTYCPPGYGATAKATGYLWVYSEKAVYVNGFYFGASKGTNTGIYVTAGQSLSVTMAEGLFTSSPGWMYDGTNIYAATIAARGQILSSAQAWADNGTSLNYDTYDFNDARVALAIKSATVACGESCTSTSQCTTNNSCILNRCQIDVPEGYSRSGFCSLLQKCLPTDIDLSSNPNDLYPFINNTSPLILGVNTSVNLARTGPTSFANYTMVSNELSYNSAFKCTWDSLNSKSKNASVKCDVDAIPPNGEQVIWTHKWCNSDNNTLCTTGNTCSKSLNIQIDPYGAYLKTDLGITYIKGALTLPRFPVSATPEQKFSKYNYSSSGPNSTSVPIGTTWLSTKDYLLFNYYDENSFYNSNESAIYEYVKSRLSIDAKTTTIGQDTTLSDSNYNNIVGINDVVFITGNLTLTSAMCNSKTAFFISGNLTFNSNFDTTGNNACLFVVKGKTIVSPSVSKIRAFIISNGFTSAQGATKLTLTGGLITQGINAFNRNINIANTTRVSIDKETPSELFIYEGARYIKLLGFLLYDSTDLSIKEIQYSGKSL
jgi:hypothetical protein